MIIEHVCYDELLFDFRDTLVGDDSWQLLRILNAQTTGTVIPGTKIDSQGQRCLDGKFLKCVWKGGITGRAYTPDGRWSIEFDAVPYFLSASTEAISDLLDGREEAQVAAPAVASFMEDIDYNVWQVARYAEENGGEVLCEIDRDEMAYWLAAHRADTWGRIRTSSVELVEA